MNMWSGQQQNWAPIPGALYPSSTYRTHAGPVNPEQRYNYHVEVGPFGYNGLVPRDAASPRDAYYPVYVPLKASEAYLNSQVRNG